ncbi:radical SAM family heme chaperone HemW [Hydrogenovibrio sp. SC-1]|uniref:radical SAM family heme chaperone HemW n=1 Tax=Hydrogenovibrio sp. SC-1 TaxID=2065820 RepID=UPI0018ECF851|nr:radical SAM family heme chaperone HemW [Hydrogenovibrio sp. SC-1]
MQFHSPLPLSLYVHYPWCERKCPYCDFNSHSLKSSDKPVSVSTQRAEEQRYLAAMIRQLEQTLPQIWGRPIHSIFFGGGTPSLISEEGLNQFLSQLRALLGFGADVEITLEANPGTVDLEKFAGFRQAGINRLSIGVQSFDDQKLVALGRIHSAAEAIRAIEAAKSAGFDNVNVDLMFALPQQTLVQAQQDIVQALELAPTHISHYQLTLEPNTPFYKQPPPLPDDDLAWDMQLACQSQLAEAGFEHYEVSAYAKNNQACRHNLNYWQFGDYIGLGAGAHGKITDAPNGQIWRTQMPASPGGYMEMIERGKMGRQTGLTAEDARFEFMLNALRLQQGFELSLFEERTGLSMQPLEPILTHWVASGWVKLTQNPDYLRLTDSGKAYLNHLLEQLLPASS